MSASESETPWSLARELAKAITDGQKIKTYIEAPALDELERRIALRLRSLPFAKVMHDGIRLTIPYDPDREVLIEINGVSTPKEYVNEIHCIDLVRSARDERLRRRHARLPRAELATLSKESA